MSHWALAAEMSNYSIIGNNAVFSTVCTIELTIQLDRRMAKMPLRTFAGMFNTSAPFQTTVG